MNQFSFCDSSDAEWFVDITVKARVAASDSEVSGDLK